MVGFDDVHGARSALVRDGIDEHQCFAPVEQVVGEVHAAYAVVHHLHPRTREFPRDMPHDLGSETVVTEEDVADTGYQDA